MERSFCNFHLVALFSSIILCCDATPPNILVIVADDLGYNDVSWHNPDIITPNLDELAKTGVILESHYVLHVCTPTRAALMTGYYPIHTGRQHSYLHAQEPKGLFTNFTLMPQLFKEVGYRTHMLGKWHLGFCHEDYIPTRRGFDTFYGFYSGSQDYYDHTQPTNKGNKTPGFDFRDQEKVDRSATGRYTSILLGERAVEIIKEHEATYSSDPMFMYLPFQNVHGPLQVPKEFENLYPNIKTDSRRIYSGMVSAMDDAIGIIVDELKNTGLFENTIILFTADNGGEVDKGGNNYPLRGNKRTLWEGGTRASAFIHSSMIKNNGSVKNELIHVVDWIPTLLTAVKNHLSSNYRSKVDEFLSTDMDGIDQWGMLIGDESSKRSEILYNIDPDFDDNGGNGAIRIGDWKLIIGSPGDHNDHYPPDCLENNKLQMVDGGKKTLEPFSCNGRPIYLFNIKEDPNEYSNIAEENQDIVEELLLRYQEYEITMIPPHTAPEIEEGNPNNFNGVWSPGWCDSEPH